MSAVRIDVDLVDGTYELFRLFFAVPSRLADDGREVAATREVLNGMVQLLEDGATHVGVATDHVIESWRNDVFPGYKTGAGVDPALRSQFELLEDALRALGVTVWAEVVYEADDALAAAAAVAEADDRVSVVRIHTVDKDLAQCVRGRRVVQADRRKGVLVDHDAVVAKFGVPPESIPDYLALVGDSADGYPGLAGFGAKTAATLLARYHHLEGIPAAPGDWDVSVRGAAKLAATLRDHMEDVLLYRRLAQLDRDGPEVGTVDDWRWAGPTSDFDAMCAYLGAGELPRRVGRLLERAGSDGASAGDDVA